MQYGCLKIREKKLLPLFERLPPPLGMAPGGKKSDKKKQLLKMGIKSDEGFIYFNELLYRLMREVYGKLRLNKRMQVYELTTQYKLFKLRQKAKGDLSKMDQDGTMFTVQQSEANVNPFLTTMFFKISFNAWHNLAIK